MKKNIIAIWFASFALVATTFLTGVMGVNLQPAYAQTKSTSSPGSPSSSGDKVQDGLEDIRGAFPAGANDKKDVKGFIHTIINWALYLAAIAAVIFIIIGGYYYIFSAGDPAKATKGRTTMVNALIGLTIIVLSYVIVQIVYTFLTKETIGA